MLCPMCGQELIRDTRDIPYAYKGQHMCLRAVTGDFCSQCAEAVFEPETAQRVSEQMLAFTKEINANLVNPDFISKVRKKLHMDQKQAAQAFGGGVNAFSRYETGKTKPPLALVKLFKVLDKHPELLALVR